jgi:hypothetical protein
VTCLYGEAVRRNVILTLVLAAVLGAAAGLHRIIKPVPS